MVTSLVIVQDDLQYTDSQELTQAPKQPSISHLRKARADVACKLARELQEVLRHASLALLRLSQPEAISGLLVHCSTTFEPFYEIANTMVEENKANGLGGDEQQSLDAGRLQAGQASTSGHFDWMQAVALQVYIHTAHFSNNGTNPLGNLIIVQPAQKVLLTVHAIIVSAASHKNQSVEMWAQDKQQWEQYFLA